jgi:hypothetical protein
LSLLLVTPRSVLAGHHPVGTSTGALPGPRGAWAALARDAAAASCFAAELAALSERELAGLCRFLAGRPVLPFRYLAVHAPVKDRELPEAELVQRLRSLPPSVDAIVVHPDVIVDPAAYRRLGRRLVIENMDPRKATGRTAAELEPLFAELPAAGLCLDIAHAGAVDPDMEVAGELLDRFRTRLRHLHVSSLDAEEGHVPLTVEHANRFLPVLDRCRDVPWILEAPYPIH